MKNITKIPTLQDLISESTDWLYEDELTFILNQEPPKEWILLHPNIKVKDSSGKMVPLKYLPIEKVEYLLIRIFKGWKSEIKSYSLNNDSATVVVRVYVNNPLTGETMYNDGLATIYLKNNKDYTSQMALPAAESFAIKDACEKWGKIFGKDLNRYEPVEVNNLFKDIDLGELFESVKHSLTESEKENAIRILKGKEEKSYQKLYNLLKNK